VYLCASLKLLGNSVACIAMSFGGRRESNSSQVFHMKVFI
jgi:hypothetical protein